MAHTLGSKHKLPIIATTTTTKHFIPKQVEVGLPILATAVFIVSFPRLSTRQLSNYSEIKQSTNYKQESN
jgi:hypothetical protein